VKREEGRGKSEKGSGEGWYPRAGTLDLGHEHWLRFSAWAPDRAIRENAERYQNTPDIARAGATILHPSKGADGTLVGGDCIGSVLFDVPGSPLQGPKWAVESWEPLTLSPSVACSCGDHGFIRDGRWVPA